MLGNAWEWTATPATPPPTDLDRFKKMFDKLDPPLSEADIFYQARGGSFNFDVPLSDWPALVREFSRIPARARLSDIGFRCVQDLR